MISPANSWLDKFPGRAREPLSRWTTLRIGGPAEVLLEPQKPEHLVDILNGLAKDNLPWRMLGGGANTLAPDGGVPGVVLHTGSMRRMFVDGPTGLRAWPGATLPALVRAAAEKGLSGLEHLIGVPGQVGGALAMNAGAADWGLWDAVQEATLWYPDGTLQAFTPEQIKPKYRNGNLRGAVLIEVLFDLKPASKQVVQAKLEELLKRKNATQPVRLWSAGCAFKNPPGDSAGRLIDACGLKNYQVGKAAISDQHANFIVNQGGATAADVRGVLEHVERMVMERFQVSLVRELVVWPEPQEPVAPDKG